MSWLDLFSIDTFAATGREVPEAVAEEGDGEPGGGATAVEVAEPLDVAESLEIDGRDEWDAETLDEIPEVDEIGEAVHDDAPLPARAFLRPRPRLWSRPGSHGGL